MESEELKKWLNVPLVEKTVKSAKENLENGRQTRQQRKRTQLTIGLYECCGKTFRNVLEKKKSKHTILNFFSFFSKNSLALSRMLPRFTKARIKL